MTLTLNTPSVKDLGYLSQPLEYVNELRIILAVNLCVNCGKIILSYLFNISQFLLYLISLMHGIKPGMIFSASVLKESMMKQHEGKAGSKRYNGLVDATYCAFCFSKVPHIIVLKTELLKPDHMMSTGGFRLCSNIS